MASLILGSFMKHGENLHTEFKEFCIKENIYKFFNENKVSNLVRNGVMPRKFNQMVLYNLCRYVDIYIPKYASSFHNTRLKTSRPLRFMIGISDASEITGIPYTSDMKEDYAFLQSYIASCLKDNITKQCCITFDIKIKQCKIEQSVLDDSDLEYALLRQDSQHNWYMKKYRKYNKKRKQWVKLVLKYKGKLQSVLEDTVCRQEFVQYLTKRNLLDRYTMYLDIEYQIDVDRIKDDKKDPTSFVYWLIKYKDEKVDELMLNKPRPPPLPRIHNVEYEASTKMSCLRKRLIQNNKKLRYYVIIIELHKNHNCDKCIKYCDPRKNHWREVRRSLHSDDHPYSFEVEN